MSVKIEYQPWKKVVIHEVVKYETEGEFFNIHAMGLSPGQIAKPLMWANGLVFRHTGAPATDEILRQNLEGTLHWMAFEYAHMDKHAPFVEFRDHNVRIPIVNVSSNSTMIAITKSILESEGAVV